MADINNKVGTISKINIDGIYYTIKDEVARAATTGGMHYIGVTSTKIADQSTTTTLAAATSGSLSKTTGFVAGDLVISNDKEFVWTGKLWSEFGSTGSLKKLAFKDSASGNVTVVTNTHTHSTPKLTHSVTQGNVSASGNYTPAGTTSIANSTSIESWNINDPEHDTTDPKIIGFGQRILTDYDTEDVTIKPVGGTTTVQSITGVGKLPTSTTKSIPNVTSIGTAPTFETKTIPNVTSVGTMFKATVIDETLKLDAGTAPTLGTAISVGSMKSAGTWPTLGAAISVNSMNSDGQLPTRQGVTVATAGTDKTIRVVDFSGFSDPSTPCPTIAETITASFSGNPAVINVSGKTSGVAVAEHAAGTTGAPSATESKTVTVQ